MRIYVIVSIALSLLLSDRIAVAAGDEPVVSQAFTPIQKLSGGVTDRTLVDIQILATEGSPLNRRVTEPQLALRFRLERAYVAAHRRDKLFETVTFDFDTQTGLPESLFFAAAKDRINPEEFPEVEHLVFAERVRRAVSVTIENERFAAGLERRNNFLGACKKEAIGPNLWSGQPHTFRGCEGFLPGQGDQYIGLYRDGVLLRIGCNPLRTLGCLVDFPFGGFAVRVLFHKDRLPEWAQLIERVESFLKSKSYP